MASRLEELALEDLCGNSELVDTIMVEKVFTMYQFVINQDELREEFVHLRGVLKLDNVTSLSTLVHTMTSEDIDII